MSFLGAELGPHALAAHQVMLQVFFLLTSGLYGLVSATTVRVGHNLGAGQVQAARFVAWLNLVVSICIGSIIAAVLIGAGRHLGQVFTQDPDVLHYIGQLSRLVGPAYFLLAIFFVSVAILQGQSRSLAIMASFLPGAWGVSVPLAFVFVLVLHLGLEALWGALVAGYATITLTAAYFVLTSDWDALSSAAIRRSSKKLADTGAGQGPVHGDLESGKGAGAAAIGVDGGEAMGTREPLLLAHAHARAHAEGGRDDYSMGLDAGGDAQVRVAASIGSIQEGEVEGKGRTGGSGAGGGDD